MVLQLLQIAASILLAARIPESRRECISNLSTAAISTAFPIFSPANALAELSSSSSSPTVKAETSENVAFAPKEGIEVILPLEIVLDHDQEQAPMKVHAILPLEGTIVLNGELAPLKM